MRDRQTPFDSMEQLFDQMRREMFSHVAAAPAIEEGSADVAPRNDSWGAGVTVEETDDGFVVLADLPGFDRDELSLHLHDDRLHLSGTHEVGDGMQYRSRRVSEQITLPTPVDPEHATASYNNGVLEVRFVVEPDETQGTAIDIE